MIEGKEEVQCDRFRLDCQSENVSSYLWKSRKTSAMDQNVTANRGYLVCI